MCAGSALSTSTSTPRQPSNARVSARMSRSTAGAVGRDSVLRVRSRWAVMGMALQWSWSGWSLEATAALPVLFLGRRAGPLPLLGSGTLVSPFRLADGPGRVDQSNVAERLREVAQQFPAVWSHLLGHQSQAGGKSGRAFEDR